MARGPSPLLLAALALAGGAALLGGLALQRPVRAPALAVDEETPPAPAQAPPPATAALALRRRILAATAPIPRLITEVPLTGAAQLWEGAGQLTDDDREHLDTRDRVAREQAAARVALSEGERAEITRIQEGFDARLAELALRASQGESDGAVRALRTLSRQELESLTALLGKDRATAYRQAEREAFRVEWRRDAGDVAAAPPVRSRSRRRLIFLRV